MDFPGQWTACWPWLGYKGKHGHGHFRLEGKREMAYRVSYTWFIGPIPVGLEIDHLCMNPPCVNPLHLEPVTNHINRERSRIYVSPKHNKFKTHCPYNHEYTPENTRVYRGMRFCRTCDVKLRGWSKKWLPSSEDKTWP